MYLFIYFLNCISSHVIEVTEAHREYMCMNKERTENIPIIFVNHKQVSDVASIVKVGTEIQVFKRK